MPRNPQACLGGIPEELLLIIFREFDSYRYGELARLRLADRRCKRIADEILYREVYASDLDYDQIRPIAENASLAKNVKIFTIECGRRRLLFTHPNNRSASTESSRNICDRALENVSNLRELHVWEWSDRESNQINITIRQLDWLRALSNALHGQSNEFKFLKKLCIYSRYISAEELSPVFRIRSLTRLKMYDVYQTVPFKEWDIPQASSNIQKLHLSGCFMDSSAVAQMISAMKGLERVYYEYSTRTWEPLSSSDSPRFHWAPHSWIGLGDALRTQKRSLKYFTMEDTSDPEIIEYVYPNGRDLGTLGSFHGFPKLRSITAPLSSILDLTAGEEDLSMYLPPHLSEFRTDLVPEDIDSPQIISIISSIRDVLRSSSDRLLGLRFDKGFLFQQCYLSNSLEELAKSGINIHLSWCHRTGAGFPLNKLRQLESGNDDSDFSDSSYDFGGESANDDDTEDSGFED